MDRCLSAWGENHDKELEFMRKKRIQRLCETITETNQIDLVPNADLVECLEYIEKRRLNDKRYVTEWKNKKRKETRPTCRLVTGATAYFDAGVDVSQDVRKVVAAQGVTISANAADATICCVKSLEEVSKAIRWHLILVGGLVCTLDFFTHPGSAASRAYLPALDQNRIIYMTAGFISAYERLAKLITDRVASFVGCKWTMVHEEERIRIKAKKVPNQTIVLLTRAEQAAEDNMQMKLICCSFILGIVLNSYFRKQLLFFFNYDNIWSRANG